MSYKAYLRGYVGLEPNPSYNDRELAAHAVGFTDHKAICLGANMTGPKAAGTVEAIVDTMVDTVNPLQVRLAAMQAERDNYHGRMDEALVKVKELTAYWTERADKLTAERDRLLAQIVEMREIAIEQSERRE